ncbi:MAG: flagellar biosynthesis anti-sigma factor FlgM [Betaproteobacteria bacterium]|jgi:negative regulator of flagellin synthesis FlgM|nr:flagellar biosynthesis anti-sigma factor FlgM [Betaproteobacteria bacterium]
MSDPFSVNSRIGNTGATRAAATKVDAKSSAGKSESTTEAKTTSASSAQVTDSVNLSNISQRVKDTPDFDRAKVESIKAALREGSYPINPRRIAENFVALEKMI